MPTIEWELNGLTGTCHVQPGEALIPALQAAQVPLDLPCGGHHTCGKCRVLVSGSVSKATQEEIQLLGDDFLRGIRLACYLRVEGDCRISTQIHTDFVYDTNFFTQKLKTFSCLAFLSDGTQILPPCKVDLFPSFLDITDKKISSSNKII